ncbi:MAG: phosphoadenosine phosphosulfate reductase family protein [Gammaproteobacteria bacterium]
MMLSLSFQETSRPEPMDLHTAHQDTDRQPELHANQLALWNAQWRDQSPETISQQALEQFQRPIISSSFGPDSAPMLHLIAKHPSIPVIWLDSGFHTEQTYRFVDQMRSQFDLNLHIYKPRHTDQTLDIYGMSPEEKSEYFKREPFERALQEFKPDLWLTGIRKDETAFRQSLGIASEGRPGIVRVAPFFYYSEQQLQDYIQQHRLPSGHSYWDIVKDTATQKECGLHF